VASSNPRDGLNSDVVVLIKKVLLVKTELQDN
jgi:hypothetical protein